MGSGTSSSVGAALCAPLDTWFDADPIAGSPLDDRFAVPGCGAGQAGACSKWANPNKGAEGEIADAPVRNDPPQRIMMQDGLGWEIG